MGVDRLKHLIAGVFLALFAVVWLWIAIKTFRFHATKDQPQLVLSTAFVTISGVLAGSVRAATATVLGIRVQQLKNGGASLRDAVSNALSPLVVAGILAYLGVGVLLIIAWLAKGDASPQVVQSFALGALGWCAGAFASVFTATN